MIDHSCGLPYHDERGEVQDCTRWQPCRKCLETECARLMRETPAAYVLELTEAFPMGDMGSGTMDTRNQAMNLCESCRVYETCKRSWKDGFAAGCEGYRTLTRADLKAVQDQLAELQNGLIVASMDADDHYRDGELAELRSQLTEARKGNREIRLSTLEAACRAELAARSQPAERAEVVESEELWVHAQIQPGEGLEDALSRIDYDLAPIRRNLSVMRAALEATTEDCEGHPAYIANDKELAKEGGDAAFVSTIARRCRGAASSVQTPAPGMVAVSAEELEALRKVRDEANRIIGEAANGREWDLGTLNDLVDESSANREGEAG